MKSKQQKPLKKVRICLVGSHKPYPAFDSVLSILKEILGSKYVMELRIKDLSVKTPHILKPICILLQDVALYLKIMSNYKRGFNAVLIFQGYYPLTCIGLKISRIKLLLYIGGSAFFWSHFENTSTLGRILVYSNLPLENICHKSADMIITLSRNMVKLLQIEKNKDKTYFALPRLDKNFKNFRIIEKYDSRKNVVGYLGALVKRKGILNFIEAIRIIERTKTDCKYVIVGGGPLLGTVKAKVRSYGLENKVKVTGFVDYHDLVKYFNEMKLYVLPSYAEGVPSTIFEAMACGTPVLATPVGAIPDVIRDGETGFLLKSNGPKHIADKIIELLNKPELLEKVSINAYNYVREDFSYEKTLESWRKIIREIEAKK